MKLKELIKRENIKRELNNPRVVFVNYQYQGPGCKRFNLYYADLLPIEPKEFIREFKKYGSDYEVEDVSYSCKDITLESEFSSEVFEEFINETSLLGTWGLDPNINKRYKVVGKEDVIYSHECSEFNKEKFDSIVEAYNFIPEIITEPINKNETFVVKSAEDKDVYGAARLDGCSTLEAYAVTLGIDIDLDKLPYVNGYYDLKEGYREYFENCFGR